MIELATLGRAALLKNGLPVAVPPDSPGFLLLVLLALGGPRSPREVSSILWPHHEPEEREEVLAQAIDSLNRLGGRGLVVRGDEELSIDPGHLATDVERFREAVIGKRAKDALALYRGPFLQEVDASHFPELERWIGDTRRDLAGMARWAREFEPWEAAAGTEGIEGIVRKVRSRRVVQVSLLYLGFAAGSLELSSVLVERSVLPHASFLILLAFHFVGFPLAVVATWILEGSRGEWGAISGSSRGGLRGILAASPLRTVHLSVVFAALALGSGAGWLLLKQFGEGTPRVAWGAALPDEKRIAVLPFRALGGSDRAQLFADGLAESLTSRLSQLDGVRGTLWVIPAGEVKAAGVVTPSEARRAFGVNLVITGTVRFTGDSLWVEAGLVDAEGLRQLRAWTLDEPLSDVFAIQRGILAAFRDLLDLELEPAERAMLTSGETRDPVAYDAQVTAWGYLQRFERLENVEEAIQLFREATERDPGYVLALSGLAAAHLRRYEHTLDPSDLQRGREAVDGALGLGEGLAGTHVTLGMIHSATGRHEEAVAAYERALELEPHSEEAFAALGEAYASLGWSDRAEETLRKAVEMRPGWWTGHNALGRFYMSRGRFDAAAEQFRRVLVVTPDNSRGWTNLGAAYVNLGRWDEGLEAMERSVEIAPTDAGYSNLGTIYFFLERYEEAARAFEAALALNDRNFTIWGNLASAYRQIDGGEGLAISAYRRTVDAARSALEMNPRDPNIILALATAHAHLNEPDRARTLLENALAAAGGDVGVLFRVGEVYERIGERDLAIRWIGEALRGGYSREVFERAEGLEELRSDPRLHEASGSF